VKVRTVEQLFDALAQDLVWRKKELTALTQLTAFAKSAPSREEALLRASVTLLYAHWEGFIKFAALRYAEFVALQRLKYEELSTPFLTLATRSLLRGASSSDRIDSHLAITSFYMTDLAKQSSIPYKDAISTQANLSSRVLYEITKTLGLDSTSFETKARLIDTSLVAERNTIAHGEYLSIDLAGYEALKGEIVGLMEQFFNQVSTAAVSKDFRRVVRPPPTT